MTFTLDLDFYFHIEDCTLASSINPSFSFAIIMKFQTQELEKTTLCLKMSRNDPISISD